ncbi:MAG: hypothetical protein BGO51_12200 [Rhodospirillales bacterium 69-11]|nr:MAG: hypothetical protein BGO51_12200 [Rhodospirillales bacterium 69-11]
MPIYEFSQTAITALKETTFSSANVHERRDLQRLLRENIEVIAPETLVISEEFGEWEDSRRRIDLLGIDKDANLVVIELKRTEDGGHMELQSIRYAAMVSTMTFERAAEVYGRYLAGLGKEDQDARTLMLDFLGWDEPDEDLFGQDVRIVLASAEFSKELTSAVLWLIARTIDIRCVRLKPYSLDNRILVDVQQVIPLPEAEDFQVQIREKARKERESRSGGMDFTRFDIQVDGEQRKAMWKRNAIFMICKRLCDRNVNPEELSALFSWRPNRVWYWVDGSVDSAEFKTLAATKAMTTGAAFDSRRWFCDDDELCRANGKTYAFSTQWGGENWHRAMNALKEHYKQFNIDFSPAA